MKRLKPYAPWLVGAFNIALVCCLIGCSPEQTARDAIAAATGTIAKAQAQHQAACTTNPADAPCVLINRAVNAQNAAIAGLETYCGWSLSGTLPDRGAACAPNKDALSGLNVALTNLKQIVTEVKGVVK